MGAAGDSVLGVPLNSRASIEGRYRSVVEHGSGCDGCVLRVTQPSGNKGGASITEEMLKQLLPICRRIDRLLSRILVLFHVDVGVFLCPCTSLDLSIWYGATGDWFPGVQHRGVSIDRDPSRTTPMLRCKHCREPLWGYAHPLKGGDKTILARPVDVQDTSANWKDPFKVGKAWT